MITSCHVYRYSDIYKALLRYFSKAWTNVYLQGTTYGKQNFFLSSLYLCIFWISHSKISGSRGPPVVSRYLPGGPS